MSKLEKADILELTVNHLTKLHSPKDPVSEAKKFQAGFGQCAAEACRFIMSVPDLDSNVSQNLVSHLSRLITAQPLTIHVPERPPFSPPASPSSTVSDRQHYYSDHERSSPEMEHPNYPIEGAPNRNWANNPVNYNNRNPRIKPVPIAGLLTTVDKVPSANNYRMEELVSKPNYYNRMPAEAKDVILQKIRQHIMDKRGNEVNANIGHAHVDMPQEQIYHDEYYARDAYAYHTSNYTLDLRKVRSPIKVPAEKPNSELPTYQKLNEAEPATLSESKLDTPVNLPEQCELPMDYSNLPPKKKRKLLEYQEYKKQEEARRQQDVLHSNKKVCLGSELPPDDIDGSAWRPW